MVKGKMKNSRYTDRGEEKDEQDGMIRKAVVTLRVTNFHARLVDK